MSKQETYEGIDFEAINDCTGLDVIKLLKIIYANLGQSTSIIG